MAQNHRNISGRRRHIGCKPNGQMSGAGLVNVPVSPATAAAPLNGTMVNGYINSGPKGKSRERRRTSADAAAAGRQSDGESAVQVSGHAVAQVTRRSKFRHEKRDTHATCPDKRQLLLLPPQMEENWENEIQDEPYGPEDVFRFELQDLSLQQRDTPDLPVTASYSPAAHHPPHVSWVHHRIRTVPDQFADAEDAVGPLIGARLQTMVSPTMKAVVDAVWAVWSIGASIYDYIHTNAMEERIHALEDVITIHQCVIGLLSAGVLALFTYILFKKL